MVDRGSGAIVNISSIAAERGGISRSAYCASKAAVNSLTRSAAVEWGETGVRVNAVGPGYVDSPMVAKAGFRRAPLKGLVDLATLLEAAGARFRWSEVVTCSRAWGTDRFVYSTLKLARQVLGAPVPSDVLTDIPHEPLDDEIVETAARFVLAPPLHRHISGSLPPEPGDPARRTRFLRRGAWPPRGQLRSQYGRPVGGILRLHVRRARDLMRRRACILLRAVVRPDCRHRVTSYLFDAGRIATWIEEAA
jgi:hypothetical protein